ncbi:GTP-binding protein [Jiella sp. M17.18]|uniref:CobW family GTP-binding protein n=1 Tax=Jiella sp. M17.18 TaxID=3234247 RepID=UPI0034E03790
MPRREPIRLTLLTGFLGAGKTTLLNRLLRDPAVTNTAVVVNEFGEAAIDPLLVETAVSDGVLALSDGCLCCSVRGELVETLLGLAEGPARSGAAPLDRVIVETTGLADPGPILAALMSHPGLVEAYALDGVVTVVDALSGARNLADQEEARQQVAVADRIVLTKTDLAGAKPAKATAEAVARLNPRAVHVLASDTGSLAERLLGAGLSGSVDAARLATWLGARTAEGEAGGGTAAARSDDYQNDDAPRHAHAHHHHHDGHAHSHTGIRSVSLRHSEPVTWDAVAAFLEILSGTAGDRILRMKGVVDLKELPDQPVVLHGVRGFLHPPARLAAWPQGARRETLIVVIARGLSEDYLGDLFAAFTGAVRTDAPDRAAVEANPLAVPGHRFG